MIQYSKFSTGGFVLHGCLGKRLSAWYDKDGNLINHEFVNRIGRSRKASANDIAALERLGRIFCTMPNAMNTTAIHHMTVRAIA